MISINISRKGKAEPQVSLTKRCALPFFKAVRNIAQQTQKAPSMLAHSFADLRDAWVESQPKKV
jgi:hypothetical protein